jgi:hypothetical protein
MSNLLLCRTLRASFPSAAFITSVVFLALSVMARAGWGKHEVDYSNYDVPLYEQITNHIK